MTRPMASSLGTRATAAGKALDVFTTRPAADRRGPLPISNYGCRQIGDIGPGGAAGCLTRATRRG
jgi:hypothetical protein